MFSTNLDFVSNCCTLALACGLTHMQGRNEGGKTGAIPRAPILYGSAKSLRGAPRSPNNVPHTLFNAVHLLLKNCFEYGGQTSFLPWSPSKPRYAPAHMPRTFLSELPKSSRRSRECSQVEAGLLRKRFSRGISANTVRSCCFFSVATLSFRAPDVAIDLHTSIAIAG